MPLPNVIKIFQIIMKCTKIGLEIRSGEITRKKKEAIVLLAGETITRPDICPYQTLSNYPKQYESHGLHKILVSGEISI